MEQRRAEFTEPEQLERPASVVVEHTQIVGFQHIALHQREVRAVTLLGKINRNLVCDEFFDALTCQLPDQRSVRVELCWSAPRWGRIQLLASRF